MKLFNKVKKVQLVCPKADDDYGQGANAGAYYPVGLLRLSNALNRAGFGAIIDDQHHTNISIRPDADIVGIQTGTLTYENALKIAAAAKAMGTSVVFGGHQATELPEQILLHRSVKYVIRGHGEQPLVALVRALGGKTSLSTVPSLSWRDDRGKIIHNPSSEAKWNYDDQNLPLNLGHLSCGINSYWDTFKRAIDSTIDAAFVIFTHIGCGYRESCKRRGESYCLFCGIQDTCLSRLPQNILQELHYDLETNNVPFGSNVLVKCYGDNVGNQKGLIRRLIAAIRKCEWYGKYNFTWTFYCRSADLIESLAADLCSMGSINNPAR